MKEKEKDAFYFSHDSNAYHDPKIKQMRSVYGATGYGWYWIFVEAMRNEPTYKLSMQGKYVWNAFASEMYTDAEKIKQFVEDCIAEFQLFETDGVYFWSNSLIRRMAKMEKKSESARKSAEARWGKERSECDRIPDAPKEDAKKEIKENETKEDESKDKTSLSPPHTAPTSDQAGEQTGTPGLGAEDEVTKPATLEDLMARYTEDERKTIREYWIAMRRTRKTNKMADSVILNWMDKWSTKPKEAVLEGMKTHLEKYKNTDKDETYTNGIIVRVSKQGTRNEGDQNGQVSGNSKPNNGGPGAEKGGGIDYNKFQFKLPGEQ